MKHVYFVRHGESISNADGVRRPPEETILTARGEQQAESVAERFKNIPIEVVLASPYKRAYDTGKTIADATSVPLEVVDIAHERELPDALMHRNRDEVEAARIVDEIEQGWMDGEVVHEGGESFLDIITRADTLMTLIGARSETHIVIASHGLFGKMFTYRVILGDLLTPKLGLTMMRRMRSMNTGITHFVITDDGTWLLMNWNDSSHLG